MATWPACDLHGRSHSDTSLGVSACGKAEVAAVAVATSRGLKEGQRAAWRPTRVERTEMVIDEDRRKIRCGRRCSADHVICGVPARQPSFSSCSAAVVVALAFPHMNMLPILMYFPPVWCWDILHILCSGSAALSYFYSL